MDPDKTKRQLTQEIESARRLYLSTGHRTHRLHSEVVEKDHVAKPRKQRLKMYA